MIKNNHRQRQLVGSSISLSERRQDFLFCSLSLSLPTPSPCLSLVRTSTSDSKLALHCTQVFHVLLHLSNPTQTSQVNYKWYLLMDHFFSYSPTCFTAQSLNLQRKPFLKREQRNNRRGRKASEGELTRYSNKPIK